MNVDTRQIQFVLQHLFQVLGHLLLLRHSAMVLYGQDHWVPEGGRGVKYDSCVTVQMHRYEGGFFIAKAKQITVASDALTVIL